MKRYLSLFCIVCLFIQTVTVISYAENKVEPEYTNTYNEISLSTLADFSNIETSTSANVLTISSREFSNALSLQQNSPCAFENFLNENGIIIFRTDENSIHKSLDELLNFPVQDKINSEQALNLNVDSGTDIATLYYLKNGAIASHTINISSNLYAEQEEIINEILLETIECRDKLGPVSSISQAIPEREVAEFTYLTTKSYSNVRAPYGKLTVDYEFYIAKSFHSKNYYAIYPKINGYPGYQLGGSSYDAQYKSKNLNLDISTPTSSVGVEDYAPKRDNNKETHEYSVSMTIGASGVDYTSSVSNTYVVSDITIDTNKHPTSVDWEVVCTSNGRKKTIEFNSGLIFECSQNKTSISVDTQLDYTITNNAFIGEKTEVVSHDRSFTFRTSSVS